MLSPYDTEKSQTPQGVHWNEEDWHGLLTRLPIGWQEQAIKLGAWQRVRKLAHVTALLRALLVYAACGSSFRELGLWATVVGVGSLIGSQQSPSWLLPTAGRILLMDGSRLKTPAAVEKM